MVDHEQPVLEQVNAALATVNDPEIKRPITELGMVDTIDIDGAGVVHLTVLPRWRAARSRRRSPVTSPERSTASPASPTWT